MESLVCFHFSLLTTFVRKVSESLNIQLMFGVIHCCWSPARKLAFRLYASSLISLNKIVLVSELEYLYTNYNLLEFTNNLDRIWTFVLKCKKNICSHKQYLNIIYWFSHTVWWNFRSSVLTRLWGVCCGWGALQLWGKS